MGLDPFHWNDSRLDAGCKIKRTARNSDRNAARNEEEDLLNMLD
jgi:hypothetical protein